MADEGHVAPEPTAAAPVTEGTGPAQGETFAISCDPPEAESALTDTLKQIRKERDRPLFVLVSRFIDLDVYRLIYECRRHVKGCSKGEGFDILIDSPGGDLQACYLIARLFARCTNSWQALVPRMAASGATLISLGSSNIVMSEMAQLSPLDPQVISKRSGKFFETERQSPLEAFQAMKYLRQFCLTGLDSGMRWLSERGVAPSRSLDTASQIAVRMVEPVLAKIEPYDLGAFALDSNLAVEYCRRIGSPSDLTKKTQRLVHYRTLVETYPVHEFVIDLEEARELKFEVSEPTDPVDKLFDALRPHLEEVHEFVGGVA